MIPKVSVIIPNYNHANYLRQRIDSVLEQSYEDFEVIILDDCSPDDSRDIIKEYVNHPKISQIVYNEKNSGSTFKQWQKGIELARGEWIWIAESDDYCETDFLEKVLKSTVENDAVLGFSLSRFVNEKRELGRRRFPSVEGDVTDGKEYVKNKLLYSNHIYNASMVVFKKDCLDRGIFKTIESFKYAGDWVFFADLAKKGKITEVKEYLNYFRRHSQNVTGSAMKKGLSFTEGLTAVKMIKKGLKINEYRFVRLWFSKLDKFSEEFDYSKYSKFKIKIQIIYTALVR